MFIHNAPDAHMLSNKLRLSDEHMQKEFTGSKQDNVNTVILYMHQQKRLHLESVNEMFDAGGDGLFFSVSTNPQAVPWKN